MAAERFSDLEVAELLVKQTLRELVAAYSRAADRADERGMAALFHRDALVDSGVIRAEGQAFARQFVQWYRDHTQALSHCVGSSWFAVQTDEAVGESYVLALSRLNAAHGGTQALTAGRYLDRFACIAGEWKFTERRFVLDVSVDLGAASSDGQHAGPHGSRTGAADPVYELWRALVRA